MNAATALAPSVGPTRAALLAMKPKELGAALRAGHPIDPSALDDTVYRGISLGLPAWVDKLAWKTFVKTFCRDGDVLRGWNVRLEQTGLDGELVYQRTRDGAPKSFGHFRVIDAGEAPHGAHRGLLIDYGQGGNALFDPIRFLRDPVVALEPGSVDRLLGWSWLDLGVALSTPSYFLLERQIPLDHRAEPPRG